MRGQPEVGRIIPIDGGAAWFVVAMSDYAKEELLVKYFTSIDAADKWLHDCSKAQFPEYHRTRCARCRVEHADLRES